MDSASEQLHSNGREKLAQQVSLSESADSNGNCGLLYCRECPRCKQSCGVTFANVLTHITFDDRSHYDYAPTSMPMDSWDAHCLVCDEKSPWISWWSPELEVPEERLYEEGDKVCAKVKRKGFGRMAGYSLYIFTAKTGTDGSLRWCRGKEPLKNKAGDYDSTLRQVARQHGLLLHPEELKHRGTARSKQSLSMAALIDL